MKKRIIISIPLLIISLILIIITQFTYPPRTIFKDKNAYEIEVKMSRKELNYYKNYIQESKNTSSDGLTIDHQSNIQRIRGLDFICIYSEENIKVFAEETPISYSYAINLEENERWYINSYSDEIKFYVLIDDELAKEHDAIDKDLLYSIKTKYFIWREYKKSKNILFKFF